MLGAAPLVAATWQQIVDTRVDVAGHFYSELFALDPELRGLFPADLRAQKAKFVQMVTQVVISLHAPEALLPSVRALGARHAYYRVEDRHYAVVGQALLSALAKVLGADFSREAERAWHDTYAVLSSTMIHAARTAVSSAYSPRPA